MKKIIVALLLALCVLSLCACNQEKACEHTFEGPTCDKAKTCTQCGEVAAEPLKHNWMPANCKEHRHCVRCGLADETAPLHNFKDATCEKPKTCLRCELTEGEALGHTFTDGICSVCGAEVVEIVPETDAQ